MRATWIAVLVLLAGVPAAEAVDEGCVRLLATSARIVVSPQSGFAPDCVVVGSDSRVLFTSGDARMDVPVVGDCFRTPLLSAPQTAHVDFDLDAALRLLYGQDAFARNVCATGVSTGQTIVVGFQASFGATTHAGEIRIET